MNRTEQNIFNFGLVVREKSHVPTEGRGSECQHLILDGHFSHIIFIK